MAEDKFDDLYFNIMKETGGVTGLINSLFSFLFRRTDFYYEGDPGVKIGSPSDTPSKLVIFNA